MIEILPTTPRMVREMSRVLRENDRAEITCFGLRPLVALWRSYRSSVYSRTAFVDGEIAAMWGVAGTVLSDESSVWLLTSAAVESIPVAFVKSARIEIAKMLGFYSRLTGAVSRDYSQAIRFLELLGFTVEDSPNQILIFSIER